jgi:hypothetical protein
LDRRFPCGSGHLLTPLSWLLVSLRVDLLGVRLKCSPLVSAKDRISTEGLAIDVDECAPYESNASAFALHFSLFGTKHAILSGAKPFRYMVQTLGNQYALRAAAALTKRAQRERSDPVRRFHCVVSVADLRARFDQASA